jgi:hypothetical protein
MPACIDCGQEMVPFERYLGEEAYRCPACDGEDKGYWDNVFRNKNGILVQLTVCSHWVYEDGSPSRTHTPKVCWDCPFHDGADTDEFGGVWGPPYCTKNVWAPTKTNKCKIKERRMAKC